MAVVTSEPSAVPRSYGISGADQQRQGQAPGNSRQKETAGGAHHESGKPGPQSKHLTRTHSHTHTHTHSFTQKVGLHVQKRKQEYADEL